jgi:hypothetical protein
VEYSSLLAVDPMDRLSHERQNAPSFLLTKAPKDLPANSEVVEFAFVIRSSVHSPPLWPTNCVLHRRATPEDDEQSRNGDAYYPAPLHTDGLQIAARRTADGGRMLRRRCSGPLVRETFDDFREESAAIGSARRGNNCGRIAYSGVRANRLRPPSGSPVNASRDAAKGRSHIRKNSR